jgi:hypothetical protein
MFRKVSEVILNTSGAASEVNKGLLESDIVNGKHFCRTSPTVDYRILCISDFTSTAQLDWIQVATPNEPCLGPSGFIWMKLE